MKNQPNWELEELSLNIGNKNITKNNEWNLNSLKALAETFTLTAFFRSLVNYPYSKEVIEYLLNKSWLSKEELQARWDGFDKVFWDEYWKIISALSFSAIIEARWLLLDEILKSKIDKNTAILEIASWFSPRALNLINNNWFNSTQYIETDRNETIWLKQWFYNWLKDVKKPLCLNFDIVNDDILKIIEIIFWMKKLNPNLNKLVITLEWLMIYLKPEEQKLFFDKLRMLSEKLDKSWIKVEFLSIDLPSHENFTDWLLHEWFTHDDHIKVMQSVDPIILKCLHETKNDFFKNIWINEWQITKHSYFWSSWRGHKSLFWKEGELKTSKLNKYKNIPWIKEKIDNFLWQDILFAYSINLSQDR